MSSVVFLSQEATEAILLQVTRLCAECYEGFVVGEVIHYDMQHYRYICSSCHQHLQEKHPSFEEREEVYGLFEEVLAK